MNRHAQEEAVMRGPNAGYVEFTHSARHGRESLLALLIPHAVVNRDVTLYLGEQGRWLAPQDVDCTAWAAKGDERCVLMHQSFEFVRIDPDAVDLTLLAPVFPEELAEAEAEEAEHEAEQRRIAAMKIAQTVGGGSTGATTSSSPRTAFRDAALRGTTTANTASSARGGSNAAVAFAVATGRRVQCPVPTSLEVHAGSPVELFSLLEYFPRLTSLRLHDGAQMDIGEIAEYLSETLTSLDVRGWDNRDMLFDPAVNDYVDRPYPACFETLQSAVQFTKLRVLKVSCPWKAGDVPLVLRGLPALEELVIESWGLYDETEAAPALGDVPRLRTLELVCCDAGSSALRSVAPHLKRLEVLKLTDARCGSACDWLELLPSLRRLEVTKHYSHDFDVTPLLDLPPSVVVVAPTSSPRVLGRLEQCCPPDASLTCTLPSFPVQELCGPSSLYTPTVAVNEEFETSALAGYCTDAASADTFSSCERAVTLPIDALQAAAVLLPAPLAVPLAAQITRLTITCATAPPRQKFRSLVECRGVKHLSLTNPPSEHDTIFVMAGMPFLETFCSNFQYRHKIRRVQRMHSEPFKDLLMRLAESDDGTPYARAVARLLLSDEALVTPPPTVVDDFDEAPQTPAPGAEPAPPQSAVPNAKKKGPRHTAAVAVRTSATPPSKVPSVDPRVPPRPPRSKGLPIFRSLRSLSVHEAPDHLSHVVACRAPRLQSIVVAAATDGWLRDVVGSCPELTSLGIHDCRHVTSTQYRLLRHLPLLDTIKLQSSTIIDEVRVELTESMMWLRKLDLHYLRRRRF